MAIQVSQIFNLKSELFLIIRINMHLVFPATEFNTCIEYNNMKNN